MYPAQQLAAALEQVKTATALVNQLISENALRDCTDPAVLEFASTMSQVREQVSAAESVFIARVDRSGVARSTGHLTTQAWLRSSLGWERRRATKSLRTARWLSHTYNDTREAWLRGSIGESHAHAIAHGLDKAVKAIHPSQRDEARRDGEQVLLKISQQYSSDHTESAVRRITAAADPDGLRAAAVEADGKQWVRVTHVGDGWVLRGWLDNVNGAALASVLEGRRNTRFHCGQIDPVELHSNAERSSNAELQSHTAPHGHSEIRGEAEIADELAAERIYHQNALILGEIAAELLADGNAGALGGERPHVEISVTLDELARGLGYGELGIPATNESVVAAMATVRQISCDADVRRVVGSGHHINPDTGDPVDPLIARLIQTPSELLDYGRSERIVPPGLRRRLVRRDSGCVFPMCTRPAAYTHAHHVQHWSENGPTDLDNLALVCNRHHTAIHHEGWQLEPRHGVAAHQPGYWAVVPPVPAAIHGQQPGRLHSH